MTKIEEALAAAAKSSDPKKKKDRLYITLEKTQQGEAFKTLCKELKKAKGIQDEAAAKYKEKSVELRETITDEIRAKEAEKGNFFTTVEIPVEAENPEDSFSVQVQYKNQFSALAAEAEPELKEIVGEKNYENLFRFHKSLEVKKEVANDDKKLDELVEKLLKVLTPKEFAEFFQYEKSIVVTPKFDALQHTELTKKQRQTLLARGLKQTVVPYIR